MKGLDSSVVLRYILEDDPVWTGPCAKFIDEECEPEIPGLINFVVLAEIVWTIRRRPDYDKGKLIATISALLDADNIMFENENAVRNALVRFHEVSAGFIDCLIAEINKSAGAERTYSVDGDAVASNVFERVPKKVRT